MLYSIFVSCPKGLEYLLLTELESLGLQNTKNNPHGVYGDASLETIYNIALWSRLANRLHLILFSGPAVNAKALYATCKQFNWQQIFKSESSLKIFFHGVSGELRNEMFSGQVIKDAVVDYFREHSGQRPSIDKLTAEVQLHAHLKHDQVTVSLDLVGYSLHQRGYRIDQGMAPIKENVAAALLIRMHWPEISAKGGSFSDLMCGSGTIVIEAAMMAANFAPGLLREEQAFPFWLNHDESLWQHIRIKAKSVQKIIINKFYGSDINRRALDCARANANRAGVEQYISWEQKNVKHCLNSNNFGLLVMNPPYGERLGEQLDLIPLYKDIGETLHKNFQGWQAGIITSDPMLARAIGLRAHKQYAFYNGALPCQLYCFQLEESNQLKDNSGDNLTGPAKMLANRLEKNYQHLKKWANRQDISCYRVYDADLPEYAFAIDKYADHFVLQEYMPPKQIPEPIAARRRLDVMQVAAHVFKTPVKNLIIKQRKPQKEEQYQKNDDKKQYIEVSEGQARFYVNLHDYLDTGLFLDHRLLRLQFAKLTPETQFLNLFCYTGTASVHAALAGAITTNVDMSNTYLNWAKDNFKLNRLSSYQHQFIQADVTAWIRQNQSKFDVIYMDTPSFSNSKRMEGTLDIQRDHVFLIKQALNSLTPNGKLYFSTHLRTFKLDPEIQNIATVKNLSLQTLDTDFKRDTKIHQCYLIENKLK
jgi:23S rRNA (guanine2445-N2)-methyltransferase / 23S rRNA (guanine2069-N7)-methyltransferase